MINRKGTIQRKNPSSPWFNNVAKSLGYTTTDLVTKLTPSIGDFFSENKGYAQDVIRDVREIRSDSGRLNKALSDNQTMKIAQEGFKNALSDIKSGKIYNKERQQKIAGGDMDLGLGDDDLGMIDFSLDDDDMSSIEVGDGDSKTTVSVPKVNVTVQAPSIGQNNPMVKALDRQSKITIEAAQASSKVQQSLASNQMLISQKIGTATLSGLQSINDNIGLLINFQNDSMTKYIGASIKYYDENLKTMRESIDELKKMNSFNTEKNEPTKRETRNATDDIFLSSGGLNLQGYVNNVTKNVKNNPFYDQIKEILSDSDTMKWMAASPLSFISTKIVTTLMPTFLQKSMEGINKSFENFFPAMLMRINRMADKDNILLKIFGEVFGAKVYSKSSVDLSRFNRGAVPFDGETKKSIVEVIPGYLRKILAAVSNDEEVAYDMTTGKFEKVSKMKEDFSRKRDRRILNEYGDAVDSIQTRASAFKFKNPKEQEEFNKGIEQFFINLSKKNSLVNPYRTRDSKGEDIDELLGVYDFKNEGMQRLLRQAILSMDKNEVTRIFGRDTLAAKAANNKFYDDAENNPNEHNAATLFNGLGFDQHLEKKNGKMVAKRGSIFNQVDKYNFTALDYLRDIKKTLMQGIRVYVGNKVGDDASDDLDGRLHTSELKKMQQQEEALRKEKIKEERRRRGEIKDLSPAAQRSARRQGVTAIDDGYSLNEIDDTSLRSMMKNRIDIADANADKDNKGVAQWIGKFFKGDSGEKMALLREKMDEAFSKPAQLLSSVFDKVDSTLHRLVFGKDGEPEESSFFSRMMASTNEHFKRMGSWMKTKVMDPIKDSLVGENGIITKLKESDQFKNLKARGKLFAEYLFGKENKDGKRENGLLAQTGNNMLDMWDASKYYFTGNPYTNRAGQKFDRNDDSVFGQMRQMGTEFKDNIKHYLFGNKASDDVDQQKGTLTGILEGLSTGFGNFREAIFGPKGMDKDQKRMTFDEMTNTVKARMPKALAWGGVGLGAGALGIGSGLLGSLFLPGGPIGMALVGTALGFASQSDSFNNFLFGEKDTRGERLGGVVSKKVQDFFSKHKATLIGGAAIGALNPVGSMMVPLLSFGLIPAMTMGPMFGAVTGMAAALALRSDTMQKFLFGPKDMDGKRAGGILSKMFKGTKEGKNMLANVGAGMLGGAGLGTLIGQFGLLGFAFGPITGALTGAVAGIALSSDKWKKMLFGEWDSETGLRQGGMLGKFQNFMQLEVIKPFTVEMSQIGLNMKKWFTQSIANPFADAIDPMKQAFKNMTESLNKFFVDGWASFKDKIGETFENNVGKPFGMFMKENIMDPMKGFFTKLLGGIGRMLKPFAEAPIKLLSAFSSSLTEKHKKRGIDKMRESEDKAIQEQKDQGYKVGFFKTKDQDGREVGDGYFGSMKRKYFNRKYIEEAQYSDAGAGYINEETAKRRKDRDAKQNEEFDAAQSAIDGKRKKLDKYRKVGFKYDYDNFTEDGQNISFLYRTTKNASRFKEAFKNDNAKDKLTSSLMNMTGGVSMAEILGLSPDAQIDPAQIGKKQNKLVKQALKLSAKQNITGDALRKYLKIGDFSDKAIADKAAMDKATAPMKPVISAIESASAKEEIKSTIAPKIDVTNTKLDTLIDTMKTSFKRFASDESGYVVMDEFLPKGLNRNTFRRKKNKKSVDESVEPTQKKSGNKTKESLMERAVLSMEKLVQKMSKPKSFDGDSQTTDNETISTSGDNMPPIGKKKQSSNALLHRIAIYTRLSAQEMRGQLDGVGKNIFNIRRILQRMAGITDSELTGSANRDRVGVWGKIRRAMFRPFEAIGEKIGAVVDGVIGKIASFGRSVKSAAKMMISIPVNIVKTVTSVIRSGFSFTLKSIHEMSKTLLSGVRATIAVAKTALVQGIKVIGTGLVKTIGLVSKGIGKTIDILGTAGKTLVDVAGKAIVGVAHGVEGLVKGVWSVVKGAGSVLKGMLHATTSVVKSSLIGIGKVASKLTEKVADLAISTIHGVTDFLVEAGKTFWSVLTSPFKFVTKKIGQWLGVGKQEVFVTGGSLDSVGTVSVVEKLIGMMPYPAKDSKPEDGDVRRDESHEVKFNHSRPHEQHTPHSIQASGKETPFINVVVSAFDSNIYEMLADTITHALHLQPIHVVNEHGGFSGGEGGGIGGSSGINGSSGGFGGSGHHNTNTGSGRGRTLSLRNGYNRFRRFRRNGGLSTALGRMSGRFTNKKNRVKNLLSNVRNNGIRTTTRNFFGGKANNFRLGFNNVTSGGAYGTNNGESHPEHNSLNSVHVVNGINGGGSSSPRDIASSLASGFMPSNIALRSMPVLKAEQNHMVTSRRNAGYEMEQARIRQEREMLQNFRLTTMSHLENLDNNVYEILEILRNWKHDRQLPEFEIPGLGNLMDKLNNCWDCDGKKPGKKKPKPEPKPKPTPVETVPEPVVVIVPEPSPSPVPVPGFVPDWLKELIPDGLPTPLPFPIPGRVPGRVKVPGGARGRVPLKDLFGTAKRNAGAGLRNLNEKLGSKLRNAGAAANKKFRSVKGNVAGGLAGLKERLGVGLKGAGARGRQILDGLSDLLPSPMEPAFARTGGGQPSFFKRFGQSLADGWDAYKGRSLQTNFIPQPGGPLDDFMKSFLNSWRSPETLKNMDMPTKTWRRQLWDVKQNVRGKIDNVKTKVSKYTDPIKRPFKSLYDKADDFIYNRKQSSRLKREEKERLRRESGKPSVKERFKTLRGEWADDFRNVKTGLVDDFNGMKKFGSKVASPFKKFGSFIGDKSSKLGTKLVDGKVGGAIRKFANSKTGKFLGKAAAPVFGGLGAYDGYTRSNEIFNTKKSTTAQKWVGAGAGLLMGATPLGFAQLNDPEKFSTDKLAQEMYSLKNPKEWWNKYGKKNIIPEFEWNTKAEAPAWAKAIGKTDAWKATSKFASDKTKGIRKFGSNVWGGFTGGVDKFFGGDSKVGAAGKDDGGKIIAGKHEADFTEKATKKAKSVWDSLTGKTNKAWDKVSKNVGDSAGSIEKGAGKKWKAIKDTVSEKTEKLVKDTKKKWDDTKTKATDGWKNISSKVTKRVSEMWDSTKEKWDNAKKKTTDGWKNISSKVTKRVSEMWDSTKEKWDDAKKKTVDGWKNISSKVTKRVSEMWTSTKEKWDDTKKKATEGWKDIHSKVTTKVSEMWTNTKDKWDDVKKKTTDGWKDIHSKVTTKVSEIWTNTKDTWDNVKSETGKKWEEMKKEAPKAAKGIYDGALGMLTSVKDNVASFGKDIGKKATGIFESLFGSGKGATNKSKDHGGGTGKSLASYAGGALQQLSGWGGGPSKAEMRNGGVYYSQKDKRWADKSFGGANTMGDIGCAPTSAAMVVSSMTGKNVTPDQMAQDAIKGGYVNPQLGTHKSYFGSLGKYGVNMKEAGNKSPELMNSLMQNKPVVLRGQGKNGSSPYTENGHFVVATGMNSKGQILVNDPLSKSKSKAYSADTLLKNTTTSFVPTAPTGVQKLSKSYGAGAPITLKSGDMSSYGAGKLGTQTSGPFKGHYVTSAYGETRNQTPPKYYHTGIDLQDPGNKNKTRPLKAFTNGKVIKVGNDTDGWGQYFVLEDENGYRHYYAHLSQVNVKQGQSIKKGSIIGRQGNTGRVFGANGGYHLHYEIVKPGKWHGAGDTDVDPTSYLSKYKGKKSFIGDLLSNFSTGASAVIGGATSLILKAKDKVTSWFDKSFDTSELKQFKVLGQITKAFGIHQFNMMNKDKMDWLLNEASEAPNADFSGVTGPVNYGTEVRKFNAKKLFKGKYQNIINDAAKRYNVEPQLIAAIIEQESKWNPNAGSSAGARGLMQLMPKTAASLGVDDSTDPYQNIMGGTKYITQQLSQYKSLKNALMAYNWGPGNAGKNNWDLSRAPKETRDYVGIIIRNLEAYRKQVGGGFGGGIANMLAHGGGNKEENIPESRRTYGGGDVQRIIAEKMELHKQRPHMIKSSTLSNGPSRMSSIQSGSELLRKRIGDSVNNSALSAKLVELLQEIAGNTGDTAEGIEQLAKVTSVKETVIVSAEPTKQPKSKPAPKKSYNSNPLIGMMNDMSPQKSASQRDYQRAKQISSGR